MTDEEFYRKYIKDLADYRLKEIEENPLMKKCIKDAFYKSINRALESFKKGYISYSETIDWILHPDPTVDDKVKITLPSGHNLVAESSPNPDFPYEMYLYIEDADGGVQDLAAVVYDKGREDPISIYVWRDESDESYTNEFRVGIYEREVD